jgi:hypothetical protein
VMRLFRNVFFRPLVVAIAGCVAVTSSFVACDDATNLDVSASNVTSLVVLSESITHGLGCGEGASQIYKYAVVVASREEQPRNLASGIYDCFADATITNLGTPEGASLDFRVEIYAFNKAAYDAQFEGKTHSTLSGELLAVENVRKLNPTWSTQCVANEQASGRILAVCNSLYLGRGALDGGASDAGIPAAPGSFVIPLDSLVEADGGALGCNDRFASATITARTIARGTQTEGLTDFNVTVACSDVRSRDDGDAASMDGATDAHSDSSTSPAHSLPVAYVVSPALAPATYAIELTLRDSLDQPSRAARCVAATSPSVTTRAVCKPAFALP